MVRPTLHSFRRPCYHEYNEDLIDSLGRATGHFKRLIILIVIQYTIPPFLSVSLEQITALLKIGIVV